jgi:ApaG protein
MAVSTDSSAVTAGIRITVKSRYLPDQSSPADRRYVFAYTVKVDNEGSASTRLRSRHWVITDGNGQVEEVRGPGVVGQQPQIEPGGSFEYTSGCVLRTAHGTMEGSYQMTDASGEMFDARIAPFALSLPHSLN